VLVPWTAAAQTVGANVMVGRGSEGWIAIDPSDPARLVASANFESMYSTDGGQRWDNPPFEGLPDPAANPWSDPCVFFDATGDVFRQGLDWQPDGQRGIAIARSTDGGATYPEALRTWAYAPALGAGNPDQGWMAIDVDPDSPYRNRIYVLFSDYPPEGGTPVYALTGFPLVSAWSDDGGATFSDPIDISDAPEPLQEGSSFVTTGPDGDVTAVWWDLRGRVMMDRSFDGGVTWGTDRLVRTYPAPVTDWPLSDDVRGNTTVAVDASDGPLRGRTWASAIDVNGPSGAAADAWVVYSDDGGVTWSDPVFPSDGPRGANRFYFQPRIAASPDGRLDAVWYDTRNDPASDTNEVTYDLYYAYSIDGGETFSPNVRVTEESSVKRTSCAAPGGCGERVLYEYIGLATDGPRVFPLWTDLRLGDAHQYTAEIGGLPDRTAPAAVDDLEVVDVGLDAAVLRFTAPGDDGSIGTATSYDLRIATSAISKGTWDAATPVAGLPAPSAAGTVETVDVPGLDPHTTYWAALTASDEVPSESPLSNVVTFTTEDVAGDAGPSADGGGGGGGHHDDGGCGCAAGRGAGSGGFAIAFALVALAGGRRARSAISRPGRWRG